MTTPFYAFGRLSFIRFSFKPTHLKIIPDINVVIMNTRSRSEFIRGLEDFTSANILEKRANQIVSGTFTPVDRSRIASSVESKISVSYRQILERSNKLVE